MSNTQTKLLEEQATIVINTWTLGEIKQYAIDKLTIAMMENPIILKESTKFICPECNELKPNDDRVTAGMKCGPCAY